MEEASGEGSTGTGWEGATFPAARGHIVASVVAPIPSTLEPRPLNGSVGRRWTGWELGRVVG